MKKLLPYKLIFLFMFFACDNKAQRRVPDEIPSFTFYELNANAFTSQQLKNDKKIVFLFFSTECGHCQDEVAAINQHIEKFASANVYMVSNDSPIAIKRFMATYGPNLQKQLNFKVLMDPQHQFVTRFLPDKYPAFYVYSAEGKLLDYTSGEQKLEKLVDMVD